MKYIIVLFFAVFSTSCFAQKKIKSDKLIKDYDYLIKELKSYHQGYYEYLEKHIVDNTVDSIKNSLAIAPLSKLDFYKIVRYTAALTNEGHTSVNLPKSTMIKLGLSNSFLPLAVKFLNKELIVTQNYGKETSILKGDKIIEINGKSIEEITSKSFPLIPTDGFNTTSKYAWSSGIYFSLLYRLTFGKQKQYIIKLQEFETEKIKTVTLSPIKFTRFKNKNATLPPKEFDYTLFKFEKINDSIAYLSIPGFGENKFNYEQFYQNQFKKIDSLNIKHLIIDIQHNEGGTEGNENLLFSYLATQRVKKYKKVTMLPKPYKKDEDDKDFIFDKWELKNGIAERGEFTLYSDYYSDLGYTNPQEGLIYTGKVYILISGITFSGGAEFASLVKMSNRGVFIGQETGGTYEGNVSGYSEYIKLPNTKIEVKIPTVHFQINVSPKNKGKGVIPDYIVYPSWSNYMQEQNALKEFTIKLITK